MLWGNYFGNAVLFLRHDWAQPLIERLTWATEVLRTATGSEVRTPLRLLPRRQITYFVGHDPMLRALVADWAERYQGVAKLYPLSQNGVCVRRRAPAGVSALSIASDAWTSELYGRTYPAVSLGATGYSGSDDPQSLCLLLWDDGSQIVTVLNEDPGVIYLDGALTADVPAGAVLLPLRQGRCTNAVALEQWAGGWAGGTLTVQLDTEAYLPVTGDPSLSNLPVWPDGDWAEATSASAQSALTAFDFSQADPAWRRDDDVPITTFTRAYNATGADAAAWVERLYAVRGRAGAFWLADGLAPDMTLVSSVGFGDQTLYVDGADAAQGVWTQAAAVRVQPPVINPGQAIGHYRCAAPSASMIELPAGSVQTFHPAGSTVSRLLPCRLDADAVELGWIAPQTLQFQLTARRVPLPPAAPGGGGY